MRPLKTQMASAPHSPFDIPSTWTHISVFRPEQSLGAPGRGSSDCHTHGCVHTCHELIYMQLFVEVGHYQASTRTHSSPGCARRHIGSHRHTGSHGCVCKQLLWRHDFSLHVFTHIAWGTSRTCAGTPHRAYYMSIYMGYGPD